MNRGGYQGKKRAISTRYNSLILLVILLLRVLAITGDSPNENDSHLHDRSSESSTVRRKVLQIALQSAILIVYRLCFYSYPELGASL